MRPLGSPEELERRRHRAIDLLHSGTSPNQVAQMLGVSRRSVDRWQTAYKAQGEKGICSRPSPGRPEKLDSKSKAKLEKMLLKGAQTCGFETDLWTCPRVREIIRQHFGIIYHVDHIGRLLHAMGWSPQKPQRQAVERDEEAIQTWVKQDWPKIKKKRPS